MTAKETKTEVQDELQELFKNFIGKKISVMQSNGKINVGVLITANRYFIKLAEGKDQSSQAILFVPNISELRLEKF